MKAALRPDASTIPQDIPAPYEVADISPEELRSYSFKLRLERTMKAIKMQKRALGIK